MQANRRLSNFLLLLTILITVAPAYAAPEGVDCSIAAKAVKVASSVRRLKLKQAVPCHMRSRSEVETYLRETILKKVPKARLDQEGKVYQLLGMLPQGYNYLDELVKLYTEQLGGYYDADLNYYVMADWMEKDGQMDIAVHELTHALQDQYFDLNKFINYEADAGDTLLAKAALVEGDATAVMLDFQRELEGAASIAQEAAGQLFMYMGVVSAMNSPELKKYPSSMRAVLIFPYVSGFNFVHTLLRRGGYGEVNKTFAKPPLSTEEILHPEIYFAKTRSFQEIPVPELPLALRGKVTEPAYTDVFGEFLISTLLASWLPMTESGEAARGWGGDRLVYYEAKEEGQGLLLWDIRWDSAADSKRFFEAIVKAYELRFKKNASSDDRSANFSDTTVGPVSIRRDALEIRITVGD